MRRHHSEALEVRCLLAGVSDDGTTLQIALEDHGNIQIRAHRDHYELVSASRLFVNTGVTNSNSFSGFDSRTLLVTDLSSFTTVRIVDEGSTSTTRFHDSGQNRYQHSFDLQLDGAKGGVSFFGQSDFGNHNLTISAIGGVGLHRDSSVNTVDGDILIHTVSEGIHLTGADLTTSGSGSITLAGSSDSGSFFSNVGVRLVEKSRIRSLSTSLNAGIIALSGSAGVGIQGGNHGVRIDDSEIRSVTGAVSVTGWGGTSEIGEDHGVAIINGASIRSDGLGENAATITVSGWGGFSRTDSSGVFVTGMSQISSTDGDIEITGTGFQEVIAQGVESSHSGVRLIGGAKVESTGDTADAATINVTGTGGTGVDRNVGVSLGGRIQSVAGAIDVLGTGGNGTGANNHGVSMDGVVVSSSDAASISIRGISGLGGEFAPGNGIDITVYENSPSAIQANGNVMLDGETHPDNTTGEAVHLYGTYLSDPIIQVGNTAASGSEIQINGNALGGSGAGVRFDGVLDTGPSLLSILGRGDIGVFLDGKVSSTAQELSVTGHGRRNGITNYAEIHNEAGATSFVATVDAESGSAIVLGGEFQSSESVTVSAPSVSLEVTAPSAPFRIPITSSIDSPIQLKTGAQAITLESMEFRRDVIIRAGSTFSFGFGKGEASDPSLRGNQTVSVAADVTLVPRWFPGWEPVAGAEYVIVQRNGGSGSFDGAPEGTVFPEFFNARLSYLGGDGDDISLTLPASIEVPETFTVSGSGEHSAVVTGTHRFHIGASSGTPGDVNGDGYADFLLGNAGEGSVFRSDAGASYLIYGQPNLPAESTLGAPSHLGLVIHGAKAFERLGVNGDLADLNGDGYDDMLLSTAPGSSTDSRTGGYIVWGGPGLPDEIDLQAPGGRATRILLPSRGLSLSNVVSIGDINADGHQDLAIGTPYRSHIDSSHLWNGAVYVVFGDGEWGTTVDLADQSNIDIQILGTAEHYRLGTNIVALGDVDGDGIDDLGLSSGTPTVHVIRGGDALPRSINLTTDSRNVSTLRSVDRYDVVIGGGGDINGDGVNDILVSRPSAYRSRPDEYSVGYTDVVFGGPHLSQSIELLPRTSELTRIFGVDPGDRQGEALAIIGDMNGDGYDEVAIGAPGADGPRDTSKAAGEVYILHGRPAFDLQIDLRDPQVNDLVLFGREVEAAGAGQSLRRAGDFNGDGLGDMIFGVSHESYLISGTIMLPEIPAVASPSGKLAISRPTLNWSRARDAVSYEVWLELIGGEQNPVANPTVTETSYTVSQDLAIGRYRTWVRAKKNDDTYSAWTSNVFSVSDETQLDPIPFHTETTRPTLSWDPVPGAVGYRITVSNLTQRTPGVVDQIVSGTSFSPDADLRFGRHRAWVQPIGPGDFRGTWSPALDFQIGPTLLSPGSSSLDGDVVFEWTRPVEAAKFELYLLRRGGTAEVYSDLTAATFSPAEPLPDGDYLWWIRGAAANGAKGAWSQRGEFNIGGRAVITSPQGFEVTGIPVIEWDEVKGAASYEVYLYNDDTRELILRQSGIETNSLATLPLRQGSHRVWVRSYRPGGIPGQWSRPLSFQFDAASSATATPQIDQLVTFDDLPTLSWQQDGTATSFNLYATDGNTVIFETDIQSEEWTPAGPLAPTKWTWWVQAVDSSGEAGPWSNAATVDSSGRPVVTAPTNPVNSFTPTFEWTGVDGADWYDFVLENLTLGQTVIREDELSANRFTPLVNLSAGTYRVWIQAVSSTGQRSPWSLRYDVEIT